MANGKNGKSHAEKLERVFDDIADYYDHSWKNFSKDSVACTVGNLLSYLPIYSFYDAVLPKILQELPEFMHFMPDMDSEESFGMRWKAAMGVGLVGYIIDKIRRISRKRSKGKSVGNHDGKFSSVLNGLSNTFIYKFLSKFSWGESFSLSLGTVPVSYVGGRIDGRNTDVAKYLVGFEPTDRLPSYIKNLSQNAKYGVLGLMIATSAIITTLNYKLSDYLGSKQETKNEIQVNKLEKNLLLEKFPEFKGSSLEFYNSNPDGCSTIHKDYFEKE